MSNFNTTNQNNNIYPKSCIYQCNTQIFWNTATSEYWEVFTKKKHICPNGVSKSMTVTNKPLQVPNGTYESINPTSSTTATSTNTNTKPTYYSKKPGIHNQNPRCPTHLNC